MIDYFAKLKVLKENSYAPYSKFHVSAICLLKDGVEVSGVNIENASYPVALCAERTCLAQVYTLGYQKNDITKLFLYTDSQEKGSPCGMCRQFILELVDGEVEIEIFNSRNESYLLKVKELLPYSFTNNDLK